MMQRQIFHSIRKKVWCYKSRENNQFSIACAQELGSAGELGSLIKAFPQSRSACIWVMPTCRSSGQSFNLFCASLLTLQP